MFLNICEKNIIFRWYSNKFQILYSIVIIATCVFNLICAPSVVYMVDDWSNAMSTSLTVLQSRVVAITSIISRGIIVHKMLLNKHRKYKTTLESFDIYSPMCAVTSNRCKLFSAVKFTLCLLFMLPFNMIKLYKLFSQHPNALLVTTYFFFFYFQNFNMFLTENHFTDQCFMVYTKFREINDNLKRLKAEQLDTDRFPFAKTEAIRADSPRTDVSPSRIIYGRDFYHAKDAGHPLANTVELLKIRHWLTREAVTDLNRLFGVHIGMSIFALGVQALFDVYTEVFHFFTTRLDKTMFRSKGLFIGWVLQYSVRFCVIAITSNVASKQVHLYIDK